MATLENLSHFDALAESVGLAVVPSAACIVACDRYFTLLWANDAFYRLMGCSEQEMGFRYARRLSALWDEDASDNLARLARGEFGSDAAGASRTAEFRHCVKTASATRELRTSAVRLLFDDDAVICCFSSDCSREAQLEAGIDQLRSLMQCVSTTSGLEAFSYDVETRAARVISSSRVLNRLCDGSICPDFPDAMVDAGLVHPEDEEAFLRVFSEPPDSCSPTPERSIRASCDVRLGGADAETGRWRWYRLTLVNCRNEYLPGGSSGGGVLTDITEHKELIMKYLNETQFYYAMLAEREAYAHVDATANVIMKVGGIWNLYNELVATASYWDIVGEFMGKVVHPDDRAHYTEIMRCENFISSLENGIDHLECEFRRIVEQNKMVWMKLAVHLLRDPATGHVLALLTIMNIDKKKRQELMLQSTSERDPLTGTLHKKAAEAAIRARLRSAAPCDVSAFMILDIDDFKRINDERGHKAGDAALIRFIEVVRSVEGKDDVLGRFGGDEFILFVSKAFDEAHVTTLLDDLLERLARDAAPSLSCSVGVAMLEGEASYDEAFRRADIALYEAKAAGKGVCRFYRDAARQDEEEGLTSMRRKRSAAASPPASAETAASGAQEDAARASLSFEDLLAAQAGGAPTFADFLSEQGEIAYLVDPDTFSLICGNQAFYDRIGETPSSCMGMKCYEAMQGRTTPCPFCSKANWSTDKFFMWKNNNEALEQEFLIKNKLVSWQGREVLLAIAVDISNDKSIVDSLDNGMAEGHYLLAGIQQMNAAESLADVLDCALATVAGFFRADCVRFWTRESAEATYRCTVTWSRKPGALRPNLPDNRGLDTWLISNDWSEPIMVESPEAVLRSSFALYRYMVDNDVDNMRWAVLRDGAQDVVPSEFLSVENLHVNLQNVSFLEQFAAFVVAELRKRRMMDELLHASSHDDLTGLLNRDCYERRIAQFDADGVESVGVVSANVNDMKRINAAKGFAAGNYYLKQFAIMLTDEFSHNDVYRLNGDEFAVIACNLPREELERRIRGLRDLVDSNGLFTTAIGFSWDEVEKNVSELTEQAVAAMEADKRRFHDTAGDGTTDDDRRASLRRMVAAIENGLFLVYLQPKVSLETGEVIGAEALVRYRDARRGIIAPGRFIQVLEENGLIRHVDLFVFEQTCRLIEGWGREGRAVPVSVNLSRRTVLDSDIISSMESIARRYDIDRSLLEIEITESFATVGKGVLYQTAADLLTAGFSLSLDDFGTKYTDLSILSSIDFNMIKLDKSLIDALGADRTKQIVVKHIIGMCDELRIDVIAEGVETAEQEQLLRGLGCRLGQGYLYSRPLPVEDFEHAFLAAEPEDPEGVEGRA
ncbi:bifunctional diguanylate cyclase/phosphodiesterase [Arabiibacter massiliensis]|uniref:bifunctional diguanylate cyclase/phosphodiesterase n=1 Tax=Arabiibacter massiliensis TaxID=1870985 RepID=UPI00155B2EFF|nr:bifunctional diguanylate cyclase/phosphodiesterase [Arabiibacter massiliensis]